MSKRVKNASLITAALALAAVTVMIIVPGRQQPSSAQATSMMVPVELVLLVDTSGSVDEHEYGLQKNGYADAFMDDDVAALIQRQGGIAVIYIEWDNADYQSVRIPWTHLKTESDCRAFASQISTLPRLSSGWTRMAPALAVAVRELETNGFTGLKKVIDVSGDGRCQNHDYYEENTDFSSDYGVPWNETYPTLSGKVTEVNGICITTEQEVVEFYRDILLMGETSFMLQVKDFEEFGDAIRTKLLREISRVPGMYD